MSAAGTRPVPTALASWPGVSDLLPDVKLLLFLLWSSPSSLVSTIGVGGPGTIERLTSSSRLDEPVILDALRELERRGLVALDENSREVGIRRWCRFHKFSGRWAAVARRDFEQIASLKIKGIWAKEERVRELFPPELTPPATEPPAGGVPPDFPEKSTATAPNCNCNNNSNKISLHACNARERAQPAAGGGGAVQVQQKKNVGGEGKARAPQMCHGVPCWSARDLETVGQLVSQHGAPAVEQSAKKIAEAGATPFPSVVLNTLSKGLKKNGKTGCNHSTNENHLQYGDDDPIAAAAARSRARRAAAAGA